MSMLVNWDGQTSNSLSLTLKSTPLTVILLCLTPKSKQREPA